MKIKHFIFLICTGWASLAMGQNYELGLNFEESPDPKLAKELNLFQGKKKDSLEILNAISSIKSALYENGFFLSEGLLKWTNKKAILNLKIGKTFTWLEPEILLPKDFPLVFVQQNSLKKKTLNQKNIKIFCEKYLSQLENNGYPFAQINFSEYKIEGNNIKGKIEINPGPFITIDSIVIKGFNNFSSNIIKYNFLFSKGMIYNESYLERLKDFVAQIEFLEFERSPAIAFSKEKTILYLYLKEVKSNQVDGVIGLNTEDNGDISFNGDFQLRLLNILKKGEEIELRWRRPDNEISDLKMLLNLPFLFGTRFGIQGDLQIFRQDSTFVNTTTTGTVKYLIESGSFLNLGIGFNSSNLLLSEDVASLSSFQTVSYSLGFERKTTNNYLSPTKGNDLLSRVFTSNRRSGESNLNQYGWELNTSQYFTIYQNHILKCQLNTKSLIGESLFINEVYRIGGLKTLRGFNEQSIFASAFGIGTLEYRYMIGGNNYLAAFGDLAFVQNQPSASENVFIGVGSGLNFETNGGIFSLFLAIGKDNENPFDLRTSKIHFGYINRF